MSRRQAIYEMRGLSFREYLEYEGVLTMEPLTLTQLLAEHIGRAMAICEKVKILPLFRKYLKEGYYPFYKTIYNGIDNRLLAVVNQVIENDYPQIDDVTPSTIRKTKKMLMVLAERVPQQSDTDVCPHSQGGYRHCP
jgi:predicted AAA+ superfamily ATPase